MKSSTLIQKLQHFRNLSVEDREAIERLITSVQDFAPRQDITSQGDKPSHVHLLLEGWACRYKVLSEGERHIMAYLIPGDLCDVHVALLERMDHSIAALSSCKVAMIPVRAMEAIMEERQHVARALWWATLLDEAILREWLVTLGARPADQRVAHLLCEMLLRSRAVGLTTDDSFELPLTQQELADTMGISIVHMNRTLKVLRDNKLIAIEGTKMAIKDTAKLMEFAEFDPTYLHQVSPLQGTSRAR
jgi:CRP-like cAMP-binding protein